MGGRVFPEEGDDDAVCLPPWFRIIYADSLPPSDFRSSLKLLQDADNAP